MDRIRLYNVPESGLAMLREITGVEEQTVIHSTTADAVHLLEQLLDESQPGFLKRGDIRTLTAWDRDHLLAAAYMNIYGPRIESTVRCMDCHKPFDLDFSLPELLEALKPDGLGPEIEPLPGGRYRLPDGLEFRLPTGEDECEVAGLPEDEAERVLLHRCVQTSPGQDIDVFDRMEEIEAAMETIAPLVDLEMDAQCPECGESQQVHFDLQYYLLSAIGRGRAQLMREIHTLASAYGWSLSEILNLPRSQRRILAGLVDEEGAPEAGAGL